MIKLDHIQTLQKLAFFAKKPCMYISFVYGEEFQSTIKDILQAAPYLNEDDCQLLSDESGYIIFDSQEEMEKYYDLTVGDDGPTESNSYKGSGRVYALTCGADGELQNENT